MPATYVDTLGLPDILADALRGDDYTKGDADYSITELLKPPGQVMRERTLDYTEELVSRMWSVFGRATHKIVEEGRGHGVAEARSFMDLANARISGAVDYFDGVINDWKTCKKYTVKDGPKLEWEAQLNGYAMLAREAGHPEPTELVAWAMLKDWTPADVEDGYPYPLVRLPVPKWTDERARKFFTERIRLHQEAQQLYDTEGRYMRCSSDDRWAKGGEWAAVKRGAKKNKDGSLRATKKFATQGEANAWISKQNDRNEFLAPQNRPPVYVKCKWWCPVRDVCSQNKEG